EQAQPAGKLIDACEQFNEAGERYEEREDESFSSVESSGGQWPRLRPPHFRVRFPFVPLVERRGARSNQASPDDGVKQREQVPPCLSAKKVPHARAHEDEPCDARLRERDVILHQSKATARCSRVTQPGSVVTRNILA